MSTTNPLSDADAAALRMTYDIAMLDPVLLERAQAGFRHAYEIATDVTEGRLDPLSA